MEDDSSEDDSSHGLARTTQAEARPMAGRVDAISLLQVVHVSSAEDSAGGGGTATERSSSGGGAVVREVRVKRLVRKSTLDELPEYQWPDGSWSDDDGEQWSPGW